MILRYINPRLTLTSDVFSLVCKLFRDTEWEWHPEGCCLKGVILILVESWYCAPCSTLILSRLYSEFWSNWFCPVCTQQADCWSVKLVGTILHSLAVSTKSSGGPPTACMTWPFVTAYELPWTSSNGTHAHELMQSAAVLPRGSRWEIKDFRYTSTWPAIVADNQ